MIAAVLGDRKPLPCSVIQLTEGDIVSIHRKIRRINSEEGSEKN